MHRSQRSTNFNDIGNKENAEKPYNKTRNQIVFNLFEPQNKTPLQYGLDATRSFFQNALATSKPQTYSNKDSVLGKRSYS